MKAAAIDLGTNSFLCLVGEGSGGQIKKIHSDQTIVTRLGEGVHTHRKFSQEALLRAESAFQMFRQRIDQIGVDAVQATATSAARDVSNGQALFDLGKKYNIPIQIISGDEEARLTFRGGTSQLTETRGCAVIDVGGGSTEFIYQDEKNNLIAKSIDVGAVRLTEMFVTRHPVTEHELVTLSQYTVEKIAAYTFTTPKNLIAVAGTPTSLACAILDIDFSPEKIDGFCLDRTTLEMWVKRLASMTLEERARLKGIGDKRADIIVAGAVVLLEALKKFKVDQMTVSTRGLRYGLIMNLLNE